MNTVASALTALTNLEGHQWHSLYYVTQWATPIAHHVLAWFGVVLVIDTATETYYVEAPEGHCPLLLAAAFEFIRCQLHLVPMPEHECPAELVDGDRVRVWLAHEPALPHPV